ncbi:DUF2061 domain-containing protein [Winogradskyella sp.]|uniref:DUF2061 domain-containing protein n=1 Tax=Winogradskyella sp. TaxID=1883156 RepID=UPI0025DADD0D|nr:DUF2061 domain-containing protein [Winogradskyella sp.]
MDSVIQTNLSLEKKEQVATVPQENVKRSIVKTISWRMVGTLATVVISYLITGTLTLAFSIGGIELVSKMVLYFFHERAWNNIKWGK